VLRDAAVAADRRTGDEAKGTTARAVDEFDDGVGRFASAALADSPKPFEAAEKRQVGMRETDETHSG
jgi:hypothetical protein